MLANTAIISAFKSSNKKRQPKHQKYIIKRLRQLYNEDIFRFKRTYGENPNTVFMSKFILKYLVPNTTSIIKTNEEDGICALYYGGIRIILTKINIIVSSFCSTPDTIESNLHEINSTCYDLIKSLDKEYFTSGD